MKTRYLFFIVGFIFLFLTIIGLFGHLQTPGVCYGNYTRETMDLVLKIDPMAEQNKVIQTTILNSLFSIGAVISFGVYLILKKLDQN